jgi:hypothetical protein
MEKDKINSEARSLIDKFGKDIAHVKIDKNVKQAGELRQEKEGEKCDSNFRTIMFKNAKHKNEVSLILEKGNWN